MTTKQNKSLERKVASWRKMSAAQRRSTWHSTLIDQVKNSMAMEKEPVSEEWLSKMRADKA